MFLFKRENRKRTCPHFGKTKRKVWKEEIGARRWTPLVRSQKSGVTGKVWGRDRDSPEKGGERTLGTK